MLTIIQRLDDYKVEVLDENGTKNPALALSLGIGENPDKDGNPGDIFDFDTMANFSHGLWGPVDTHFANPGFFDGTRAYYKVGLTDNNQTISHVGSMSGGNYQELFGNWLTNAWALTGVFYDDDMNPVTDAKLVAFWGDPQHTGTNAWHKGKTANWAVASETDLLIWSGEWYGLDKVEDVLNLGVNYIVNVGDNTAIGSKFTIRITPHIDTNQTEPFHVAPPAPTTLGYEIREGIIVLDMQEVATTTTGDEKSAAIHDYAAKVTTSTNVTLKNLGAILVWVADHDLNQDPNAKETITVAVKSDHGEIENVVLTESGVDTSRFTGTLEAKVSNDAMVNDDGKFLLSKNTKLIATYVDSKYGTRVDETLEAVLSIEVAETPVVVVDPIVDPIDTTDSFYPINSSSGGGCTYNPNSKSFDMSFLLMMALGLLYPFRRRFIK